MEARRLDTKINVYLNEVIKDEYGGSEAVETFVKSIYANVRSSSGFKFQNFGIADFKNPIIFTVRGYKNQINFTENHFIKYKGVNYFVKGIENVDLEGTQLNIFADGI